MQSANDLGLTRPATCRSHEPTGWAGLDLDIRLMIWELAYLLQDPRVVEVRTAKHDHYSGYHDWCPRYSPSPPPTIVNVCGEARAVARRIAQGRGHLLFATTPDAPDIYFNPAIDTLYVPNEKDYWIRDWGPEGVLTQFKKEHQPGSLRVLAIGLDPVSRGTTPNSLESDLDDFRALKHLIFVVEQPDKDVLHWVSALDRRLAFLVRTQQRAGRGIRAFPDECKLATRRGGRLQLVEKA